MINKPPQAPNIALGIAPAMTPANAPGQVSLVGAGPGDPDLLTLKAVKTIAAATVILVDDLVNEAVLAHAKSRGLKVWGYTDRGTALCSGVDRTGSLGREALDAAWFAARGIDFIKEDSCAATDDHEAAFAEYALMRDGINATGRPMIFNLCGWNPFYAPVGHALANSWRIGPDAAQWSTILVNLDFSSDVWRFAGPGGFNDLDMLGGCTVFGPMSSLQRRAQFVAYAMAASPLVLSVDVRSLAPEDLETYSNAEVIAVGRDPLGRASQRLLGADLERSSRRLRLRRAPWRRGEVPALDGPAVALQPCTQSPPAGAAGAAAAGAAPLLPQQRWAWNATGPGQLSSAAPSSDAGGTCLQVDACGAEVISFACHLHPGLGFNHSEGFLAAGSDLLVGVMTLSQAQALCLSDEYCLAITFASDDATCNLASGGTCNMYLKSTAATFSADAAWQRYTVTWPAQRARPRALDAARARAAAASNSAAQPISSVCPGCAGGDFCNTQWTFDEASGSIVSYMGGDGGAPLCLTAHGLGQALTAEACVAGGAAAAQTWLFSAADGSLRSGGDCATTGGASSVNVWGRPLADGSFALAAVNAGLSFASFGTVCDFAACLGPASGFEAAQVLAVRDVLGHVWLANITAGAGYAFGELAPGGGVEAVILTPIW